jgi:anti-sigma B factor antagonist
LMIAALLIFIKLFDMITIVKEEGQFLTVMLELTEANLSNSDQFKAELIALLDKHQKKIIIELDKLHYVDSSFLGALVGALKHAMPMKLDIILVGLRKDILDLMKLIRLDKVFKIFNYAEDAYYALK